MDGATANARRKYHHVHHGGKLTEHDIAGMVRGMENKDAEIARLTAALERTEANREAVLSDLVEVTAERDALRAENQRLREAEKDAVATLAVWFDRRKLAHEAIDQAVIDAAEGYLRTSRLGGMPHSESDLVLGVISDMARLSLFADLFARAALAKGASHDQEARLCNIILDHSTTG